MPDASCLSLSIALPSWVDETVAGWSLPVTSDTERMRLAIELSRRNVERGGGPFAALVYAGDTWLGAGVNRVIDTGFSIAHAEILALMTAQQRIRGRLSSAGRPLTLVTTTEPCCQCYGALVWAGVEHLVCGATTTDAERIGFDEGPKPEDWVRQLQQRGMSVVQRVLRQSASDVLEQYASTGGTIYGRSTS